MSFVLCLPRRENFKNTEWVKVPKVLWDYSSSSVLTMEYTPGVKINKGARCCAGRLGGGEAGMSCPISLRDS